MATEKTQSTDAANAAEPRLWKLGESSRIDSIFGTDAGGTYEAEYEYTGKALEYDSGQIEPPEWLAAFVTEADFENALKIIKADGVTITEKTAIPRMIRAIQRTAALDAIRDFFYAKAKGILEKGGENGR